MTSLSFKKDYQKPDEERDRMYDFIKWGKKNDYPYFLVDLYNGSAWHQGIIKNKVTYIAGGGLESTSGDMTAFIENKYSEFDMNEIVEMLSYDYELFGGFCVMGTWNRDGSRVAVWEHIDLDSVRVSEDGLTYYLSDDWTSMQQSPEKTNLRTITALDMQNKEGKFIIYYKDPSKRSKKEKGAYPKPPYYGGITAIQTDADISRYHMHEIANSFKSGTLISFTDGYPETYEEAERIKQQVKGRSQSVEDAGEIVITFSDNKDKAPIVQQLSGNDLDKRYLMTEKSVQQNILVSHSVVAPSLFGVAPEGSFNASESADLFEIFKKTYVDARQRRLEWMLNYMVELSGYVGSVKLKDVSPITVGETAPAPSTMEKQESENKINHFCDCGEDADNFDKIASFPIAWDTPNDVVMKRHDMLFDAIGTLTIGGQGVEGLDGLGKSIGGIQNQYEIRYSYREIPGIPPVKTKSRDFCAKLISLNKLYSRDEINTISSRLGYDVWIYKGGWYNNPETKKTTPWCRHEWVQQIVIKKIGSDVTKIDVQDVTTNEIKISTIKEAKEKSIEIFETNQGIKVEKVTISRDMSQEKLQRYINKLNELTREYGIANESMDKIELLFRSTSRTYGQIQTLNGKLYKINLGHQTDLGRGKMEKAF